LRQNAVFGDEQVKGDGGGEGTQRLEDAHRTPCRGLRRRTELSVYQVFRQA
jgi:hypothetical protein